MCRRPEPVRRGRRAPRGSCSRCSPASICSIISTGSSSPAVLAADQGIRIPDHGFPGLAARGVLPRGLHDRLALLRHVRRPLEPAAPPGARASRVWSLATAADGTRAHLRLAARRARGRRDRRGGVRARSRRRSSPTTSPPPCAGACSRSSTPPCPSDRRWATSLGGAIGSHYGWRAAFLISGIPGLLLALVAYRHARIRAPHAGGTPGGPRRLPRRCCGIARTVRVILGYAAYTFGLGGIAFWMPTFLERVQHLSSQAANYQLGVDHRRHRIRRDARRRLARRPPPPALARGVRLAQRREHAARRALRRISRSRCRRPAICTRSSRPRCSSS